MRPAVHNRLQRTTERWETYRVTMITPIVPRVEGIRAHDCSYAELCCRANILLCQLCVIWLQLAAARAMCRLTPIFATLYASPLVTGCMLTR
jgi:hypothetical protein